MVLRYFESYRKRTVSRRNVVGVVLSKNVGSTDRGKFVLFALLHTSNGRGYHVIVLIRISISTTATALLGQFNTNGRLTQHVIPKVILT